MYFFAMITKLLPNEFCRPAFSLENCVCVTKKKKKKIFKKSQNYGCESDSHAATG
jgi:hypothetical protein